MWATWGDILCFYSPQDLQNNSSTLEVLVLAVHLLVLGINHWPPDPHPFPSALRCSQGLEAWEPSSQDLLSAGLQLRVFQSDPSNLHGFWHVEGHTAAAAAPYSVLRLHSPLLVSRSRAGKRLSLPSGFSKFPIWVSLPSAPASHSLPHLSVVSKPTDTLNYFPFCLKYMGWYLFSWLF